MAARELEQARVAAENSRAGVDAAADEIDRLREEPARRDERRRQAERVIERLRGTITTTSAAPFVAEAEQARASSTAEELPLSVEQIRVLAEELEISNEELWRANDELERRVAERTAALAVVNAALATHNRELEQRVRAEAAAREAAHAARVRQEKLEALGQLTGGVAHDFNNLLTVVMSGLQLLSRADTVARREQLIGRIGESVARGAALTQRLLAFGRRQALHPEPLDLAGRLDSMGELLSHSLRGDMRIVTEAEPGLWPVEVDHGALELALLNLAVNARDAMPYGGVVTLAAGNRRVSRKAAAGLEVAPGEYVAVSVADSEVGMHPDVLARAFEPFFSTKESGKGTGLGLAQVYGFARQSGGGAHIYSVPGEGCAVTLLLPRSLRLPVAATLPVVVAEPQPPAPPAPRPAAILVVEDDPEVAALVTELLVTFGHLPTRVASIEAALGALGNGRELDLVFSDVMLPGGGSGLDLAHEISRRRPELPILLTTGSGGEMTAPIESMPWPLLRKPFRPEELRTALEGALGQVSPEAWGNRESDGHAQRVLTQRQELAALRAENTALKQEIAELQRRLGMGSSNSSKPPASDGLGKKPRIAASLPSVSGKLRAPAHRVTASNAARSKRT